MKARNSASVSREQIRILKVLAHPARIRILLALRDVDACVCRLTTLLGERQPYVSQQLGYLRAVGLVETHKVGLNVFYHASKPCIFEFLDLLNQWERLGSGAARREKSARPRCVATRCKRASREFSTNRTGQGE